MSNKNDNFDKGFIPKFLSNEKKFLIISLILINFTIGTEFNQSKNFYPNEINKQIYPNENNIIKNNNNESNQNKISGRENEYKITENSDKNKKEDKKNYAFDKYNRQFFNNSNFENVFDFSNIPPHLLKLDKFDEILSELASRKYKNCKASVIYHPLKKEFYFRNPTISKTISSNSLKDFIKLKCRDFTSREISLRQRFLFKKKDVEEIMDNNQDSILNTGKHEITDFRNGLEMTLFPVKFFKSIPDNNYSYSKHLLCYDSIKVLGLDSNSDNYYIISAMDKHRILNCNSVFYKKDHNTMNNFIKYTSYCDEFCSEDYIYFSNDLIKCKCEFYSSIQGSSGIKGNFMYEGSDRECFYRRKFDSYEKFSHPYEMNEKLQKIDQVSKPYFQFYFNLLTIIFSVMLLYMYYFVSGNKIFMRVCIFSFIIMIVLLYFFIRINFKLIDLLNFQITFELIHDLYPILLILFFNMRHRTKDSILNFSIDNNENTTTNLGETSNTHIKDAYQNINNTINNNNLNNFISSLSNSRNNFGFFNNQRENINENFKNLLKKLIAEYDRIQFDRTNFKLCVIIIIDLIDHIFREIRVNEIELTLRIVAIIGTFFLRCNNLVINLYCFNVRMKLIMEFISRSILFLADNLYFTNITIPLFIILGRPREYFQYHDHLLYQLNYLILKPNTEKFVDNWFLEALNYHKIKNMILFLKLLRYLIVLFILTLAISPSEAYNIFNNFLQLKFAKILFSYMKLVYNIIISYLFSDSKNKLYYILTFPFFFVYMSKNILLTRDTIKIFIFHFLLGLILNLLEEKDFKLREKLLRRSTLSTSNIHGDYSNILHDGAVYPMINRFDSNRIPINRRSHSLIRCNSSRSLDILDLNQNQSN